MSAVATESASHAQPAAGRIARFVRSAALRAMLGANIVSVLVMVARGWGLLQPFELWLYDRWLAAWSGPPQGDHVLLVSATEDDVQRGWPLKDGDLAALLERIASLQPCVIAVDIYRDHWEPPGTDRLKAVLGQHKEIVWGFLLGNANQKGIAAPPSLRGSNRADLVDVVQDGGNVVRRALLYEDDGAKFYPTMGLDLAMRWLARGGIRPDHSDNGDLRLGKAVIAPLDEWRGPYVDVDSRGYQMLLDYHGGPDPFPRKSVGEIMHDESAASLVRGRAVIVGVAAESVKDMFTTPFDTGFSEAAPIYGIALHADVADQLIREALGNSTALRLLPREVEDLWIWGWAILGGTLGMFVGATIPVVLGILAGVAGLAGIVYAAFGAALLLPALPAAIAWVGSAGLANQLLHAANNRARARLRKTFEHYLPSAVIAEMIKSDTLPQLGGERREISVVFSDVANFTTLSEKLDPVFLADLINEYFDGVCAAVFREGGFVNEFVGDGVLAFFGAPHLQPDHADRAVAAALGIDAFAQHFSADCRARDIDFGHSRIGVHTGIAFVGNIGSRSRLKYAAQGDTLNTGSRLEGLNKAIGTRICVSGETVRQARRHRFRQIGAFVVKGRHGAIDIFEPLAAARCNPAMAARYEAAFRALESNERSATDAFAALRQDYPDDPAIAFHCARLAAGQSGARIVMKEK
jgi:adenylate cyclase